MCRQTFEISRQSSQFGASDEGLVDRRNLAGFTLLELLVVIAVMGVLAGVLLPSLNAARQKALAARCVSNLRQLYTATLAYCNDRDDFLPFAWISDPSADQNNFYALLQPEFLGTTFDGFGDFERSVFLCPVRTREPLVGGNPFRVSYGMNAYNAVSFPGRKTFRIESVPRPSETVLIADINYSYNHPAITAVSPDQLGYKHQGMANVLFMDGHVASYTHATAASLKLAF